MLQEIYVIDDKKELEEKLKELFKLETEYRITKVVRNGNVQVVPAKDIVPGDIVILDTGDYVPADLRLIEAVNLKIQEAALTRRIVTNRKKHREN